MNRTEVAEIKTRAIGQSLPRVEDPTILTGRAQYVADVRLPGMLHAAFLRSPFAHAAIKEIDSEAALALPGVERVFTGADLAELPGLRSGLEGDDFATTTQPFLANSVTRYAGEPVAMVVARERRIAEDALERIAVDFEELPRVTDAEHGLASGLIANDQMPNNVLSRQVHAADAVDVDFAAAAVVAEGRFDNNRVSATPIETRGCVARFDWTSGQLKVWIASQMPSFMRTAIAAQLEIPEHSVEVIAPFVGGGFGQKAHVHPEELAVCVAARELAQPVSWIEDRRENLLAATHSKDQVNRMALAADSEGRFLAIQNDSITDAGAYNTTPWTAVVESYVACKSVIGAYKIPRARIESTEVATNKCPIGIYRSVGLPAPQIAIETLIDRVARELDLSPFEVRRRNVVAPEDFPYTNRMGMTLREASFLESVDELERFVGYDAFRERQRGARERGEYLGLGLSVFNEVTTMGTRAAGFMGWSSTTHDTSTVRMEPSGSVVVTTALHSTGTGVPTTLGQVAADALGVTVDKVVVRTSTTQGYGMGTAGSRAAVIGAGTIGRAADVIRTKIKRVAGRMLEVSPEDLELEDNRVHLVGFPDRGLPMEEVVQAIYFDESTHPDDFDPTMEATAAFDPAELILANGAHAVIVNVDIETGFVRVEKVYAVEDCGQMINPMIVEGQIRGGVGQAIGMTLLEELIYDDRGRLLTTTLQDYLLPNAEGVPDIEIRHLMTPSDLVPGGIKGMAESAMISVPAAIVGAVNDALAPLGVGIETFPLSPERVFEAIQGARADS